MSRLVFCISVFILLFVVQTAHPATTSSLPLRWSVPISFGDSEKLTTSEIPGFSLLPYQASSFDYNAPSIFTREVKKDSEPCRTDDFRTPIFGADAGNNLITGYFHHSDVYSYDDNRSKRNLWFPTDRIEDIHTTFTNNDGGSNLRALVRTDYQGWIPDVNYDLIDVVPAPGAIILGGLGIGMIGWMRRRRTL